MIRIERDHPVMMRAVVLIAVALLAAPVVGAGVSVTVDAATLNTVLAELTEQEVAIPLGETRTLAVFVDDFEVTGFEPSPGNARQGFIRTSLVLRVPEMGMRLPVEPRISLNVVEEGKQSILELRFEDVSLQVPLLGSVDIARFLPPIRFPAENLWTVGGATRDVEVRSRLDQIKVGREAIRFEFNVDVLEPRKR